jgi:8-oxo-dGTP pyrophosphatase MutT (NUDIX family)
MIITRPVFIDRLHHQLIHHPLPGREAHLRMAHQVRKAEPHPIPDDTRDAAVLITFFERKPDDWHLIFVQRGGSLHRDKHAGQISFPGGKKDPNDRDLMYTALREAEEEIGLDLAEIDVLGSLTPLYISVSKFLVYPYVSFSRNVPILSRQESEIEAVMEIALHDFLRPDTRTNTRISLGSGIVLNHVPAFTIHGQIIWGATAMIMNELLEVLPGIT